MPLFNEGWKRPGICSIRLHRSRKQPWGKSWINAASSKMMNFTWPKRIVKTSVFYTRRKSEETTRNLEERSIFISSVKQQFIVNKNNGMKMKIESNNINNSLSLSLFVSTRGKYCSKSYNKNFAMLNRTESWPKLQNA